VLALTLALVAGTADAGGRKRIVVLEFEGPHAERFHDDLVKLLKKSNTVVPTDKWNGTAEELDAATVTEKNVKKVAKKLKVDGVVQGKIEKRRDEYIVRIKLRAGTSGEIVGNPVDTKADSPHLDGHAQRDIKDELGGAIDELDSNHGGGGGDDDDADDAKPSKKKKVADADDSDDSPRVKKKKHADDDDASDDDSGGSKKAFSKHADKGGDRVGKKGGGDDDDSASDDPPPRSKKAKKKKVADDDSASADDDSSPKAKKKKGGDDDSASKGGDDDSASKGGDDDDDSGSHKKAKKRVAKSDDDGGDVSAEASADDSAPSGDALSATQRAVDVTAGLSFVARHLTFSYSSALAGPQIPPGYKQSVPVAGGFVDATVYPLAINHKRHDALAGLGVEFMYNRVLRISSKKSYTNMDGSTATATLGTSSEAYGLGAVYRYPLGKLAIGGRLMYMNQSFLIAPNLPDGSSTDIPDVQYSMVELGGFARYPLMPKITIDADAGFLAVLSTGTAQDFIGNSMEYGKASTYGFDLAAGAEYQLTRAIFLRAQLTLEEVSMKFANNSGTLANTRDGDGSQQDVFKATDLYYGAMVTAGYAY
jgi:hypothetical protein